MPRLEEVLADYRADLKTVRRAKPNMISAVLTALDHFYAHHLGRPQARRKHQSAPLPKRSRPTSSAASRAW